MCGEWACARISAGHVLCLLGAGCHSYISYVISHNNYIIIVIYTMSMCTSIECLLACVVIVFPLHLHTTDVSYSIKTIQYFWKGECLHETINPPPPTHYPPTHYPPSHYPPHSRVTRDLDTTWCSVSGTGRPGVM